MGKRSKRPGRAARDVHAAIREQAERLRSAPAPGIRDADDVPEVAGLLGAARQAVESGIPRSIVYFGRPYYLRVRLALQVDVFDSPAAALPLVQGATFSSEGFGHAPGH